MARAETVEPVKIVVAALFATPDALASALERLERSWGAIDFAGEEHPFDVTDYYEPEMGSSLTRRLIAFATLVSPEALSSLKHETNRVEDTLACEGKRRVNLDVGYLDHHKLVLGSFKSAGQKIYVGEGVWADIMCRYREGALERFAWTFPDFRDGRYDAEILEIRRRYMRQLRARESRSDEQLDN